MPAPAHNLNSCADYVKVGHLPNCYSQPELNGAKQRVPDTVPSPPSLNAELAGSINPNKRERLSFVFVLCIYWINGVDSFRH